MPEDYDIDDHGHGPTCYERMRKQAMMGWGTPIKPPHEECDKRIEQQEKEISELKALVRDMLIQINLMMTRENESLAMAHLIRRAVEAIQ